MLDVIQYAPSTLALVVPVSGEAARPCTIEILSIVVLAVVLVLATVPAGPYNCTAFEAERLACQNPSVSGINVLAKFPEFRRAVTVLEPPMSLTISDSEPAALPVQPLRSISVVLVRVV